VLRESVCVCQMGPFANVMVAVCKYDDLLCVCVRERVCVCVCMCDDIRHGITHTYVITLEAVCKGGGLLCVCERETEKESVCVERVCVCVC